MLASSEIDAAIDRSMPPTMITSIWPSARMATRLPNGSTELHDADVKMLGATIAQTMARSPVAIQMVAKRVLNKALPISVPKAGRRDETALALLSELLIMSDKRSP